MYDEYEPYEDDLEELGNREAWDDLQAELEQDQLDDEDREAELDNMAKDY